MQDSLARSFRRAYGRSPACIARAPGRLEVLGNHTDYNQGYVISCATEQATWLAAAPSDDGVCRLRSRSKRGESSFTLDEIDEPSRFHWTNYVKGILVELRRRGHEVSPFNGFVASDVPLSAGMSSSAALEMATCLAMGALNVIDLPPAEWARIGQACENQYVGANTGLLDQFSSLMGKRNQLVFLDFRTLEVESVPCPEGVVFVVANSGVKHNLTEDYNERRQRCEEAAAAMAARDPKVQTLRDVSMAELDAAKEAMHVMAWRRAKHIVGEDERVLAGIDALRRKDIPGFGKLLFESHQSSRENFENSCPELDILVETARTLPGCYGARLSGGGFGGISIHLVDEDAADTYRQRLATAFATRTGVEPQNLVCAIGDGARLL